MIKTYCIDNNTKLKIDSGITSIDACVNDASIVNNFIPIDDVNDVNIRSATNNELNVIGTGVVSINNKPVNTYVCSNLVDNLISSHALTSHPLNLWIVFPPKKYGGGAICMNDNGKVIINTDKNYYITSSKTHVPNIPNHVYRKSIDMINELNKTINKECALNDLHKKSNVSNMNSIYSIRSHIDPNKPNIPELVLRTQQKFYTFSQGSLVELAKSGAIANFPVTSAQLNKYWHENVPHILGTFTKPSVRKFVRHHRGEPGDIVSTDRLGPITPPTLGKNDGVHVFIDYATLFQMLVFSKSQTSIDLASVIERVSKKYSLHNHKIKLVRQDALPAAMTPEVEDKTDDLGIRQEFRSCYIVL
jgi:hypothetical protein